MKNTICFLLMIGLFSTGLGQTTTLPDKTYGPGGTRTVTTTTNKHGETFTVTEIKDPDGKVRDRQHTWKDANGHITVSDTNFTNRGNVFSTLHQEFDKKGTLLNSQSHEYKGGNVIYTHTRTKKDDGSYDVHIEDKEKGKTSDTTEPAGTTHIRPPEVFKHPDQKVGCSSRFGVSIGYSYLSSEVGDEKKGYPFGAIVLGRYNLDENEKWAVTLEGSLHIKKEDDYTYKQSFLLGGLSYDFKEKEKCRSEMDWGGYIRFMLGYGFFSDVFESMGFSDKFKDCGPAAGLGGGLNYRVCKSVRAGADLSYIGTKISDDMIGGIRANVGVEWNFHH